MYKKLVKRSRFNKILVVSGAPVTVLVEGDEAYASYARKQPANQYGEVEIIRQIEREQEKALGKTEVVYPIIGVEFNKRIALAHRFASDEEGPESSGVGSDEGNLLCGFSDYITFQLPAGRTGSASIILETVHYEERK